MAQVEIFVDKPFGRFSPVAGVHAARKHVQLNGRSALVHDLFLEIPQDTLEHYFQSLERAQDLPELVVVYMLLNYPEVDESERFARVNARLAEIRRMAPGTKVYAAGFLAAEPARHLLTAVDGLGLNGYASLFEICVQSPIETGRLYRKPTNFVTANGYAWDSAYLMVDTPKCLFVCGNCMVRDKCPVKNVGEPWKEAAVEVVPSFSQDLKEVAEIGIRNLCLVENALTVSREKHLDLLRIKRGFPDIELHVEATVMNHLSVNPDWASYLREANFRCCNFSIYGMDPLSAPALELPAVDTLEMARAAREALGKDAYLMASIIVGLPGDTLANIETRLEEYLEVFDCVDPLVMYYLEGMPFLEKFGYEHMPPVPKMPHLVGWRNLALSSRALDEWLADWSAREARRNPAFAAYRSFASVVFASSGGYASAQVRADIEWAKTVPNGGVVLEQLMNQRDEQRRQCYLDRYHQ